MSASRGSHGGNQHSHGLYTTPESKMCGRWAPTIVERIQRHIHGQVPTTAMLKGKEQVKRACMLDTHVYINPWKVICRYTFSLSLHQHFPIPRFRRPPSQPDTIPTQPPPRYARHAPQRTTERFERPSGRTAQVCDFVKYPEFLRLTQLRTRPCFASVLGSNE